MERDLVSFLVRLRPAVARPPPALLHTTRVMPGESGHRGLRLPGPSNAQTPSSRSHHEHLAVWNLVRSTGGLQDTRPRQEQAWPSRVQGRCPFASTAATLYDNLDFMHGVQAFLGALRGASLASVRRGHLSVGVEDNSFLLFSELMDSTSLFLTANCDTVYFWGFVDLSDGPMVIEVPALPPPPAFWARSTTCGSTGSLMSDCPARIEAKAAAT